MSFDSPRRFGFPIAENSCDRDRSKLQTVRHGELIHIGILDLAEKRGLLSAEAQTLDNTPPALSKRMNTLLHARPAAASDFEGGWRTVYRRSVQQPATIQIALKQLWFLQNRL